MPSIALPANFHLKSDSLCDFQMHTIHSDGFWTPDELFGHLEESGFCVVAVTDHDRTDTIATVQSIGNAHGIAVVAAVEITGAWDDHPADLLCFGLDTTKGAVTALTNDLVARRTVNASQVNARLQEQGYAFPRQGEILNANAGQPTHPIDNVRLLREHGYADSFEAAVRMITGAGFVDTTVPLADAVAAVHADGGLALLAHPGRADSHFRAWTTTMFDRLDREGIQIDGIEVYYPKHSEAQTHEFLEYAQQHGWVWSAGSDSHARDHLPIPYEARLIQPLLERLGFVFSH